MLIYAESVDRTIFFEFERKDILQLNKNVNIQEIEKYLNVKSYEYGSMKELFKRDMINKSFEVFKQIMEPLFSFEEFMFSELFSNIEQDENANFICYMYDNILAAKFSNIDPELFSYYMAAVRIRVITNTDKKFVKDTFIVLDDQVIFRPVEQKEEPINVSCFVKGDLEDVYKVIKSVNKVVYVFPKGYKIYQLIIKIKLSEIPYNFGEFVEEISEISDLELLHIMEHEQENMMKPLNIAKFIELSEV